MIHNRIDRSVAAILKEFGGVDVALPEIEEKPDKAHPPDFMTERPAIGEHGARLDQHGKGIDACGFMLKGKRLRTRQEKIDRVLHAH